MRRTYLLAASIVLTAIIAACSSRHWQATKRDGALLPEPSGIFVPMAAQENVTQSRFSLACTEKGKDSIKLMIDPRLKKDQKFKVNIYKKLEQRGQKIEDTVEVLEASAETALIKRTSRSEGMNSGVSEHLFRIKFDKSAKDGGNLIFLLDEKEVSYNRFDLAELHLETDCKIKNPQIKSNKDILEKSNSTRGHYQFANESVVEATKVAGEISGDVVCPTEEGEKSFGFGKLIYVEYFSNDVLPINGVPRCGGEPFFRNKKIVLNTGEVLEQIRIEYIDVPVISAD